MIDSLVPISGGKARLNNVSSYLELPWAFGDTPFTIVIDANYGTGFGSPEYLVSQMAGSGNASRDFQMVADPISRKVTTSFCNQQGICTGTELGAMNGEHRPLRHHLRRAGRRVSYNGLLLQKTVSGTLPDVDGQVVRFGNPTSLHYSSCGARSKRFGFSMALTRAELLTAMSIEVPRRTLTVFSWMARPESTISISATLSRRSSCWRRRLGNA